MPQSVIYTTGVEFGLIFLTTLFLLSPSFIFDWFKARFRTAAKWGGVVLLIATFCWSVVLGLVLAMNDLSLKI